ncbi:DUF6268 family outer membrane beta-barrel protein [Aquimarina muelleri]|uniref:Outer membrane protein beta-barrel domain-containing protein n=1 Tax=Aquimarina muelleri TaxID=279356 RepID=A0A918JRV4_9FLAO|nr:DUF6268 family outer membrane beta-barrel protein [Aquimarina muelleri]MCX2764356.1 DUF6268 family outer membrane beta-barrel protein [Aquimarina muelleri]GGX04921.1 hypothetical protein GCM10007384_03210 [Aquimarina muelleri]
MRCKFILFFKMVIFTTILQAQMSDLARVEYTYFPQRDSDNSFRRFRAFARLPIKLNDKGSFLVPGIEYRNVNFIYRDKTSFNTNDLERFSSIEASLGYTFKLKNYWRFAVQSGVIAASNFEEHKLISDDLLFTGSFYFIKDKKNIETTKPWRLILGLQYSTSSGRPFPLPFVNYYRKFHPSWSFVLGVPKSNLKYYFKEKNILQSFITLDGFFANIQKNRNLADLESLEEKTANNISMTIVLAGFGYERLFTDHLLFYTYTGFTIINDIRLRNGNQDNILTINDQNSLYIRAGLKLKL